LIRFIPIERGMRIVYSFPWSALLLPESRSDRRAHIPTHLPGRGCIRTFVRIVAAAISIQALSNCARRPIMPDGAAASASIKENALVSPSRHATPLQSRPDCQFKVSGLGDTWLDPDDAAPRSCVTRGAARNQPNSSTR
jgi:hypothetical protein